MSAAGGMHGTVRAALLLFAVAAAGLTGCEYADGAASPPPVSGAASPPGVSGPASPAASPVPARDREIAAAGTRNLALLEAVLGKPDGMLFGGSGGIGDTSSGGFMAAGTVSRAGQYNVTAACIGAPDAQLSVSQNARAGGTLLELSIGCGGAVEALVDLEPGEVSAHLVRYGGSLPGPWTGAVAGIRVSFIGTGQ
jgi:hypothetical protein